MKKQVNRKPRAWQTDASKIETEKVQFWANGVMKTATMDRDVAKDMVNRGGAFVISEQAIGAIDANGNRAS